MTASVQPVPSVHPTRRWPWGLLLVTLLLLATVGLAVALWHGLPTLTSWPIDLTVDGERVLTGFQLPALTEGESGVFAVVLALVVVSTLFVLLAVVVPLVLLSALVLGLLAVVGGIGLPLLAVAGVAALLLSPLWLLGWLLWRLLRGPTRPATTAPQGVPA